METFDLVKQEVGCEACNWFGTVEEAPNGFVVDPHEVRWQCLCVESVEPDFDRDEDGRAYQSGVFVMYVEHSFDIPEDVVLASMCAGCGHHKSQHDAWGCQTCLMQHRVSHNHNYVAEEVAA